MGAAPGYDAVVVGAGPNGLTAAARLATAGMRVIVFEAGGSPGGGSRTAPLGDPSLGARYDVCAAAHPLGAWSPAFAALGLERHGVDWLAPPTPLAHPFDDGSAAVLHRSVDATASALGPDAGRWRAWVGGLLDGWPRRQQVLLGPVPTGAARHPITAVRAAWPGVLPVAALCRRAATRDARALLAGLAAHTGVPLTTPTTAGVALVLAAAAHATGMPVAAGGSQSVVDALSNVLHAAGGHVVCDHRVRTVADLPPARAVLLDVTPQQAASLLGRRPPRWRAGTAACKLDLLLSAPLPWTNDACRSAGTLHLGGDAREVAAAERSTYRGAVPDRPFVIVVQPSLVDPSRAPAGRHVVWAYRHVPPGSTDARAVGGIERQLDRFAPGWRDLVVHRQVTTAAHFAAYNPSYPAGDITGGALTAWQTLARPRLAVDPYRIRGAHHHGAGVWLCSQSTPPGPGVHGMCGWHAAGSVLRHTRDR